MKSPASSRSRSRSAGGGPVFATARAAEEYLLGFINYERLTRYRPTTRTHDLKRFALRLEQAGWIPGAVRTVHVGGTNGKGTVCWLLERILHAGGLRTGLYSSPHLATMRERVRIDGRPLGARPFAEGVGRLATAFGDSPGAGFRTTFEHLTALAFLTFQEEAVDVAILEVGLGGRLDATNVIPPGPAVLTPIGLDHRNILGRTLSAIAADKAHILKPGGEAFLMPQPAAVRAVLDERLWATGIPWQSTSEAVRVEATAESFRNRLRIEGTVDYGTVTTRLLGAHQAGNVAAAVRVAERFLPADRIGSAVRDGLDRITVPGRMEVLERRGRTWILDGGHNPAAARAVRRALEIHAPGRRITAVVGMASDKDHRAFLRALAPRVEGYVFTRAESPRAASPELLQSRTNHRSGVAGHLPEALVLAEREPADVILIAGSFLLVAEARELLGA